MTADLALLRQLYRGPTLVDEGARLAAQFGELSARPSVDGCHQMVRSLADASTAVTRLRSDLMRGQSRANQ